MRTILFAVTTLLAPMLFFGIALAASPSWAIWPAAAFMTALLVATAIRRPNRISLEPFVPFGMLLFAVVAFALVTPSAALWLLWPVLLTTLAVILVGTDELVERKTKPVQR